MDLAPCRLPGAPSDALCGTLAVPENPAAPGGRRIGLQVVELPARSAEPAPDPVFFFIGGPGVGASSNIPRWARMFDGLRERRDVVLVDPRGTGRSNPLPCSRPGEPSSAQTYLGEMYPPAYVDACRKALERRADLRFYTTYLAAGDMDAVRAALGYQTIDVIGGSYGSRSGYVYMARYPQRVRTAVLWSINPPRMDYPSMLAQHTERALDRLLADCAADPSCGAEYPELREEVSRLLGRLRASPVAVEITNPLTGSSETVSLAYSDVAATLRGMLYSDSEARWIPAYVHLAAGGDLAPLAEYAVDYLHSIHQVYADGLYLSVMCTEHEPYIDQAAARAAAPGTMMGSYRLDQQSQACARWPKGTLPPGFFDAPPLATPTLILSGELDPVTPPELGQILADSLPHSLHRIIPHHAHGLGGVWEGCLDEVVGRFLGTASLEGLGLSCLEGHRHPPFASWRELRPDAD